MANNLPQFRRTATTGLGPNTTNSANNAYIPAGSFAVNLTDKKVFSSDGSLPFEVGSNLSSINVGLGSLSANTTLIQTNDDFLFNTNNKRLSFATVNTASNSYFIQQNDDNFVFYSTSATYTGRPIWSVFANSSTSNIVFSVRAQLNGGAYIAPGASIIDSTGSQGTAGQVLTSNGASNVYWSTVTGGGSVDSAAQYSWTNTHTFNATVAFKDHISIDNANAIYFNGLADANWKMGRNTNAITKWIYSNNTVDVVIANSTLEGYVIGLVGNSTYFETGHRGTFVAANLTIGSATSNATINSTSFSGTSNNATNLNGLVATAYVSNSALTTQAYTFTGLHTHNSNIAFGSSTRILGDFTNATVNSRAIFQTSTLNGATGIYAYPNGTSGGASWQAANSADGTNASKILIATNGATDVQLVSGINGTGTYLPLTFYNNNAEQMRLAANGNFGVGNTAPAHRLAVTGISNLGGNSTIVGFANVTGTIQGGSSLTVAGAASGITTLAAGNTTITGFANVTTSVNAASHTVGTNFIANATTLTMSNSFIAGFLANVNTQTASYTLANTDSGKIVEMSNSTAATTITLPATAPAGFNCTVVQVGTSNVTFANATGTTLFKRSTGANSGGQWAMSTVYVRTNVGGSAASWVLGGDTL